MPQLTIDGLSPRLLDGRQVEYFSALVFLRNDLSPRLRADELLIRRERFVGGHLHERVVLLNVSQRDLALRLGIELAADFADILSVKQHDVALGEPDRAPAFPAAVRPVQRADPTQLVLAAPEGDLRTEIAASRPLTLDDEGDIVFEVELARNDEWTVEMTVEPCVDGRAPRSTPATHQFGEERDRTADALRSWQLSVPQLRSPDAAVAAGLPTARSSTSPPSGCRSMECTPPGCPAAGVPWFMTIFGRDTLITCLQTLLLGPDLARTALHALAELQAVSDEPTIDAEPGKIVHELRQGARGRQLVFALLRIRRCHTAVPHPAVGGLAMDRRRRPRGVAAAGGARGTAVDRRSRRPRWRRFRRVPRRAPGGLDVQSWKDSWDSQRFADGRVATPPIAAAEVQGYVFDAKTRLAEIALVVWRDRELAARLEHEAAVLSQRFDRAFWVERGGVLRTRARPGQGRVDSHCSNMGQLLWSGIVPSHRVDAVADQLFSDGLWSGWGVRTMSRHDSAYGPLAYHNGTVWPHDNSLIAWGLARYGRHGEARRIARDAPRRIERVRPRAARGLHRPRPLDHAVPGAVPDGEQAAGMGGGHAGAPAPDHARPGTRPRARCPRQPLHRPAPRVARGHGPARHSRLRHDVGRGRDRRSGQRHAGRASPTVASAATSFRRFAAIGVKGVVCGAAAVTSRSAPE